MIAPTTLVKRLRKTVKKEWWPVGGFLTAGVKELGRLCLLAGGLGADLTLPRH